VKRDLITKNPMRLLQGERLRAHPGVQRALEPIAAPANNDHHRTGDRR